ncbi:MAG: ORF6N domain-containing protein [Bacteroidales bacterium]|nr:ORF6N domain-containing protein [Bacteroidales bacterium]
MEYAPGHGWKSQSELKTPGSRPAPPPRWPCRVCCGKGISDNFSCLLLSGLVHRVETKVLNQAVRRNIKRFPLDFMFQLDNKEFTNLKSQFVTSSWGGRRTPPRAFTEEGIAMLASVLHSDVAIAANISILRAFVKVREYLPKVDLLALQREEDLGAVNDLSEDVRQDIDNLYLAIADLSSKLEEKKAEPRRKIGFQQNIDD